jgi:hypothetical protein
MPQILVTNADGSEQIFEVVEDEAGNILEKTPVAEPEEDKPKKRGGK